MQQLYRIIDCDTDSIVADGLTSLLNTQQLMMSYQKDYPSCKFEIDRYTK